MKEAVKDLLIDLYDKCHIVKTELMPNQSDIAFYSNKGTVEAWEYVIKKLKAVLSEHDPDSEG